MPVHEAAASRACGSGLGACCGARTQCYLQCCLGLAWPSLLRHCSRQAALPSICPVVQPHGGRTRGVEYCADEQRQSRGEQAGQQAAGILVRNVPMKQSSGSPSGCVLARPTSTHHPARALCTRPCSPLLAWPLARLLVFPCARLFTVSLLIGCIPCRSSAPRTTASVATPRQPMMGWEWAAWPAAAAAATPRSSAARRIAGRRRCATSGCTQYQPAATPPSPAGSSTGKRLPMRRQRRWPPLLQHERGVQAVQAAGCGAALVLLRQRRPPIPAVLAAAASCR